MSGNGRPRILLISHLYPSGKDDRNTTKALHQFVKVWKDYADVHVIRPDWYRKVKDIFSWPFFTTFLDEVKIHHVRVGKSKTLGRFFPWGIKYLILARRMAPQYVVAHMRPNYFFAGSIAKLVGAKLIIGLHGTDIIGGFERHGRYFSQADLISCRSLSIYNRFCEAFPDMRKRCFIANSGIDPDEIMDLGPYLQKAKSGEKCIRFITVSKLIALKNTDIVLHALARLQSLSWSFTIIGDGPEQEALKTLAGKLGIGGRVRFLGFLPRSVGMEYMEASDYFLMPSAPETFGLAYLEAMAKACPIVCAQGWGLDGVIRHGYNGYAVEPRNIESLTKVLTRLLTMDEGERESLLRATRETVLGFDENTLGREYYNRILSA